MKKLILLLVLALLMTSCSNNEMQSNKNKSDTITENLIFKQYGKVNIKGGDGTLYYVRYGVDTAAFPFLSYEDVKYIAQKMQLESFGVSNHKQTVKPDTSQKYVISIKSDNNNNDTIQAGYFWFTNNSFNSPTDALSVLYLKNDKNPNTRDSVIKIVTY
jgi:PBP1b-binding outer membrane lipoprotein LpoB